MQSKILAGVCLENMAHDEALTKGQAGEIENLFSQPFKDARLSAAAYQDMRRDPEFKSRLTDMGAYAREFAAEWGSDLPHLFVGASLPEPFFTPSEGRIFPSDTISEMYRINWISDLFRRRLGIKGIRLEDPMTGPSRWQEQIIVLPHELSLQQGIEFSHFQFRDYARLVRELLTGISGLELDQDMQECLRRENIRMRPETIRSYSELPTHQVLRRDLILRRIRLNPAAFFSWRGQVFSLLPNTALSQLSSLKVINRIAKAAPGELIMVASLLAGFPRMLTLIAEGKAPAINVIGVELGLTSRWDYCPQLTSVKGKATLTVALRARPESSAGSFVCAIE